jgi:hypothetical protein
MKPILAGLRCECVTAIELKWKKKCFGFSRPSFSEFKLVGLVWFYYCHPQRIPQRYRCFDFGAG